MLILKIAGAILALLAGVYWGLGAPGIPGRRDRMKRDPGGYSGRRHRAKRHFTPLDLLRNDDRPSRSKHGYLS